MNRPVTVSIPRNTDDIQRFKKKNCIRFELIKDLQVMFVVSVLTSNSFGRLTAFYYM